MDDQAVVAAQIERPLRARIEVAVRCHLGLPVAVVVPPILDDGTPFPTRVWLSCPLAVRRIGRLESSGGVRSAERYLATHPAESVRMEMAHARYAAERDEAVAAGADPRPAGGVGGLVGAGVKCLHAHYADFVAGNDNPVGEMVQPWVEPLECTEPCMIKKRGAIWPNPKWTEPK